MITLSQYVGGHSKSNDWNEERKANAAKLLLAVNAFMKHIESMGVEFPINQYTKSQISGQTLGGFRPQATKIGAPKSAHKLGLAVDIYDPINAIDNWLLQNQDKLIEYGIYIEAPPSTIKWSHWSIKPPGSKKHVFTP